MSVDNPTANVTLRAWPAPAKEALGKEDIIPQIIQLTTERGHLRGITEKTLLEDIEAGKDVPEDVMEDVETADKKEEPSLKARIEELQRAKVEMFQKLEFASFHAGNAMNLVNLCLSRDPARNLETAYTPMFKLTNVPRGSFGIDKGKTLDESERLEDVEIREGLKERRRLAMKGSRMEALDWATDSLLKAAVELETQGKKEAKYWEEILSISEKGWPLHRTRKEARNAPYAVRYGLPEASNHFKARGLAPLRMNKDGGIILDPNLRLKPKTLRVRISDNGQITGTSHLPSQGDLDDLAIEQSIQLSRDSLFEEELFHEMSLESRQLLGYGTEYRSSVIHIAVQGLRSPVEGRKILIDCIDRDGQLQLREELSQDWLAQNIAEALRLLLAHEHRMRLHRRSQIPPPMSQNKRQQSSPPLLRTLLAMFSHMDAVDSLHAYMCATAKTLMSAGLDVTLETSREASWVKLTEVIKEAHKKDLPATDQLLLAFTRPFDGLASISLPSSSGTQTERITIATRTYIGQPVFGSEHKLTLSPTLVEVLALEADQQRQFKFASTAEAISYLDWILALDIAHVYLPKEHPGNSVIRSEEPHITFQSSGSSKMTIKEDDLSIELKSAVLKATAYTNTHLNTGATVESFTWHGSGGQPSLKDKVKSWIG
ncbi:mediator of RNA polymerase II transcription subunit 17 [Massarina eburnea CBS 473.64]|uniref:Mediator of RNA polymerase II transcription subunit 17 n=1 Tax=Massarina eburnea CBS 473.64 TaxID=1395130 RepID=A0A6A6SDN1_9PLEO|nr:mediator of RNA polymerase II transcription subunit 17 [Massarina eburnea CBS 473.64]